MLVAAIHLTTLYELGGVTILIGFFARIGWGVWKSLRHIGHVHEAIIGRPASPGVEAIPSMIQRFNAVSDEFSAVNQHLGQQDQRINRMDSELRPNGGSSLVDKVNGLVESNKEAAADAATALAEVAKVKAATDAEAAKVAAKAVTDAAALAARTAAELVIQTLEAHEKANIKAHL